jgi:transcriptional regulator with XRE-family HTH domain/uncharacterized protein CbrC (UPF0167 family)
MTEPTQFTPALEAVVPSAHMRGVDAPTLPAQTLAQRVRTARLTAKLTQQQLAGGTYSKSYISAIECGRLIPSLQALSVLAERLGIPIAYFFGELETGSPEERGALLPPRPKRKHQPRAEVAVLTLDEAEGALWQGQPTTALRLLYATGAPPEALPLLERPRWYRCVGWAMLQQEENPAALVVLEQGLQLAETLHRSASLAEETEWLRFFLGEGYRSMGLPEVALEHHRRGLHAWQAGVVTDPALVLRLFQAFVTEALALGRSQEALECYADASQVAQQMEHPLYQGQVYWDLALAAKARGDVRLATRYFQQALTCWTLLETERVGAELHALSDQPIQTAELARPGAQHPPTYRYIARPHQDSTYELEERPCRLCHRHRPGYAVPFIEVQPAERVCEECLAAGRLAAVGLRTNAGDQDTLREQLRQRYPTWTAEAVAARVQQQSVEVETRTPPLRTWKPWAWPVHCGEYCRLLQAGNQSVGSGAPTPTPSSAVAVAETGTEIGVYLFECLHCGQALLLWDEGPRGEPSRLDK